MTFIEAEPTENYDVRRLVTPSGKWEIGLWRVLYGVRVRFGQAGAGGCVLDYCAGDSRLFQELLLSTVMTILLKVPEDMPEFAIMQMFPGYHIKPIFNDPDCWPKLQEMAARIRAEVCSKSL